MRQLHEKNKFHTIGNASKILSSTKQACKRGLGKKRGSRKSGKLG
jgi:hypothetical protein